MQNQKPSQSKLVTQFLTRYRPKSNVCVNLHHKSNLRLKLNFEKSHLNSIMKFDSQLASCNKKYQKMSRLEKTSRKNQLQALLVNLLYLGTELFKNVQ